MEVASPADKQRYETFVQRSYVEDNRRAPLLSPPVWLLGCSMGGQAAWRVSPHSQGCTGHACSISCRVLTCCMSAQC